MPDTLTVLAVLALWLLAMNVLTWHLFRIDKHRARTGEWRIAETTLLACALFGGMIGARLAQVRFRHKTRKQPFRAILAMIAALHFGLVSVGGYLLLAPQAAEWVGAQFSQAMAAASLSVTDRHQITIRRGVN